jgi:hypothetical protein
MTRFTAIVMLCFIIILVAFATWQFYVGNLEAGMSALPFLVIVYLFMMNRRKRE